MTVQPLGDEAFLLRDFGLADPYALSQQVASFPGVRESVSAYETVAVYVDPEVFDLNRFVALAERCADELKPMVGRLIEIPVCYSMGLDFGDVCGALKLGPEELINAHTSHEYTCHAIGFCPGFPYLGYLPPPLCGLSRLPSPRSWVPKGSVGITGNQTGVYPQESPGGWRLIGRTPLEIASLEDAYFPITPGDRVRFVSISEREFEALEGKRL